MKPLRLSLAFRMGALALASATLAACAGGTDAEVGEGFDDISERARNEQELVVYSAATDQVNAAVATAFGEAHPDINVIVTRLSTGDLRSRFASETETGAQSADVVIVTDPLMFNEDPDWFLELSEERVPNLSGLRDNYAAENHFAVMSSPWVVTYNEQKVGTPPRAWADLVSPEYAGNTTFADPKISADSVMAFYQILMDDNGPEFLRTLGDENTDWFESSVPAVQKVAAGQVGLAAPGAKAHSVALIESGAPVKAVIPEPVIAFTNQVAIASDAKHPNAALVFADFLLSKQGQQAFCGDALYMSLLEDEVQGCPSAPQDIRLADQVRAHDERDTILDAFELE